MQYPSCCHSGVQLYSNLAELVQAVERRRLIAFGQSRIVEDRIDEIVDRTPEDHHRLADVQQLAGAFADDMHAEQLRVSRWKMNFRRPVVSPRIWPRAISR